jgi:hypothetical protein
MFGLSKTPEDDTMAAQYGSRTRLAKPVVKPRDHSLSGGSSDNTSQDGLSNLALVFVVR